MTIKSLVENIVCKETYVTKAIYRRLSRISISKDEGMILLIRLLGKQEQSHIGYLKKLASGGSASIESADPLPSIRVLPDSRETLYELLALKTDQVEYYKRLLPVFTVHTKIIWKLIEDEEKTCLELKHLIKGDMLNMNTTSPQIQDYRQFH